MSEWNPVKGLELVDEWTNMSDRDIVIVHHRDGSYKDIEWGKIKGENKSAIRNIYLLERAPTPEPRNLGAVVTFKREKVGDELTLIRFRAGDNADSFVGGQWVVANYSAYSTWDWDSVVQNAVPGSVVVYSNGAVYRPPLRTTPL